MREKEGAWEWLEWETVCEREGELERVEWETVRKYRKGEGG